MGNLLLVVDLGWQPHVESRKMRRAPERSGVVETRSHKGQMDLLAAFACPTFLSVSKSGERKTRGTFTSMVRRSLAAPRDDEAQGAEAGPKLEKSEWFDRFERFEEFEGFEGFKGFEGSRVRGV